MKLPFFACALLIIRLTGCASLPESVMITLPDHVWILVNQDGSGNYGYAAMPERVSFAENTIDFKELLYTLRSGEPTKKDSIRLSISFRKKPEEIYNRPDYKYVSFSIVSRWFTDASQNTTPNQIFDEFSRARIHEIIAAHGLFNHSPVNEHSEVGKD
ncbi:hypothetical protein QLX67_11640 [Balneolaceae bacterium ANBcel3]|nr:hypothetical protein [Balneolaceae bacterium ANBcel3]